MKNFLIIYHSEDNDGLVSAAIIETFIRKSHKSPVIHYLPADYNILSQMTQLDIDVLNESYDSIIMTDISFNNVKMMKYINKVLGNKLTWIDHHLPAIKSSNSNDCININGLRRTDCSAILLAFEYFYDQFGVNKNNGDIPEIFRILSAWDSFTYEKENYTLEYVRNVNKGFTETFNLDYELIYVFVSGIINLWESSNNNYDEYNKAVQSNILSCYDLGCKLNNYDDKKIKRIIDTYGDFGWTVNGRTACALFMQDATNSLMFSSFKDKIDNGIVFKRKNDGNWVMSLYNTNNDDKFHCGEYLKEHYGGGGHGGAAGCTLTQKNFIKMLNTKKV